MGRRGPPPKPRALRDIEGDRSHRPPNRHEPRPPVRRLPAPKELDERGRAEWRRIAPMLAELGLLTELDRTALLAYCSAYSALIQSMEVCTRLGVVFLTPRSGGKPGALVSSPALAAFAKLSHIIAMWCGRFGLTPSDRCRMIVQGQEDEADDPISRLLDGDEPADEALIHDLRSLVGAPDDAGRSE